jgi:hypothetical protein
VIGLDEPFDDPPGDVGVEDGTASNSFRQVKKALRYRLGMIGSKMYDNSLDE